MDSALLEELLHEDESATLDFKRDQYPLENANKYQKSELIKDVLAFANSWRRADAYILIGVDEVKGGRSIPVGVDCHLDDASLQQLVNSKTNRPVDFSYVAGTTEENVSIGIIHIPVQDRPFFLTGDYGKLKENVVYIRRSSSTDEANPEEIKRMGVVPLRVSVSSLVVEFVDPETKEPLGSEISLKCVALDLPAESDIPSLNKRLNHYGLEKINTDYYRDFAKFIYEIGLLSKVQFCVQNTSNVAVERPKLIVELPLMEGLLLKEEKLSQPAKKIWPGISDITPIPDLIQSGDSYLKIEKLDDRWKVVAGFENMRPGDSVLSKEFYVGCSVESKIKGEGQLFGDNLPEPAIFNIAIDTTADRKNVSLELLKEWANNRE